MVYDSLKALASDAMLFFKESEYFTYAGEFHGKTFRVIHDARGLRVNSAGKVVRSKTGRVGRTEIHYLLCKCM